MVTLEDVSPRRAAPIVRALEWLATNGDVGIIVVSRCLPPQESPFDHLLFGARLVTLPAGTSGGLVSDNDGRSSDYAELEPPPIEIVLSPVYGRPHPQSPIEQRLARMIAADTELAPKFIFNTRVEAVRGKCPKVDLLWAEGRVVIEFESIERRTRSGIIAIAITSFFVPAISCSA